MPDTTATSCGEAKSRRGRPLGTSKVHPPGLEQALAPMGFAMGEGGLQLECSMTSYGGNNMRWIFLAWMACGLLWLTQGGIWDTHWHILSF